MLFSYGFWVGFFDFVVGFFGCCWNYVRNPLLPSNPNPSSPKGGNSHVVLTLQAHTWIKTQLWTMWTHAISQIAQLSQYLRYTFFWHFVIPLPILSSVFYNKKWGKKKKTAFHRSPILCSLAKIFVNRQIINVYRKWEKKKKDEIE